MSLVDYGDRGVPNVFLEAPLTSGGPWNAAHFKNKTYDGLVKQYVAAVDLQTQKTLAGKIETLLLERDAARDPVLHRRADRDRPRACTASTRPRSRRSTSRTPTRPRSRARGGERRWLGFILKRIGLGLITLWILSLIVFFAAQVLPGRPGPGDPRAAGRPLGGQGPVAPARHRQAGDLAVLDLDQRTS